MVRDAQSPTSTDAPLEYLTVESYAWPRQEQPPKRPRMDLDERKRRHREDQRRFMERKRSRIDALRETVALMERQLHYMWAWHEETLLREDRQRLDRLHHPRPLDSSVSQRLSGGVPPHASSDLERELREVLSCL